MSNEPKKRINDETNKPGSEYVAEAFAVIRKAMGEDPELAFGWHCNIAMMCYDAIRAADITAFDMDSGEMCHEDAHRIGNEAASLFMKICFDVETTNNPEESD